MKIIPKFLTLLCSIFFLAGCTTSTTEKSLTFATWGSHSEIKILKPILKQFENENNISIKLIHIPQNYFQKIHLLFASNQAPDVIFINNYYLPIYENANLLEDLTPHFQNEIKKNLYFNNSIKSLSINNKLFAIPRDISNMVIYYNKDLFKKNDIKLPQKNWTYEDFFKITQDFSNKNIFAIGFEEHPLFWEPILWANNGEIFDEKGNLNLNKKESLEALKFYIELRTKYNFAPNQAQTTNRTMAQLFLDEKIAMQISGRWLVPKYRQEAKFDWDIINLPNGKNGSIAGSDTSGWAISKTSKNKNMAIKFIKFLSSKEVISEITKNGLITPARKDVAYSKFFLNDQKPKNAQIFLNINNNTKVNTITKNYNKKINKLIKCLEPYFSGKINVLSDTKFEL